MRKMTPGSTIAVPKLSLSSKRASTKDITAEANRIRTSWSLNCSRISAKSEADGCSGRTAEAQSVAQVSFLHLQSAAQLSLTILAVLLLPLLDVALRQPLSHVDFELCEALLASLGPASLHLVRLLWTCLAESASVGAVFCLFFGTVGCIYSGRCRSLPTACFKRCNLAFEEALDANI